MVDTRCKRCDIRLGNGDSYTNQLGAYLCRPCFELSNEIVELFFSGAAFEVHSHRVLSVGAIQTYGEPAQDTAGR